MLFNLHTHTIFSDGNNTAEEIVNYAIKKNFKSLGFSDHSITNHDKSYCMKDEQEYILEINRLKKKYANRLQIYLGIEEDASQQVMRNHFDYIIGSVHYLEFEGNFRSIDWSHEHYLECVKCAGQDIVVAQMYYDYFVSYITARKPDIIGHFDLITKYEEMGAGKLFSDKDYWTIAESALEKSLAANCIFEVNTGAISRGYRSTPYPHERLLKIIAKNKGRVTISSDAHSMQDLDAYFKEIEIMLKSVGFDGYYILLDNKWTKISI